MGVGEMTIMLYVALSVLLLVWLVHGMSLHAGWKRMERLPRSRKTASSGEKELPLVSVILAAKEEEQEVARTVRLLMDQDYPRMEIIAVNDRSSDRTGVKLDQLKTWIERDGLPQKPLHVIHITSLPEGWLGKNHALYQGYLRSRGSFLLFMDADVQLEPGTIRDAVQYARQREVDHVTLLPAMKSASFWLRCFVHYFLFCLIQVLRPWLCNDDLRRDKGIGVGAFNLIHRKAYEKMGTHRQFAMYPDDDLELGRRVKHAGLRQRALIGNDRVEVEWYRTLGEAVRGLEKNLFSGFDYRLSLALFALAGQIVLFLFPLVGWLWLPDGLSVLLLTTALVIVVTYGRTVFVWNRRWDLMEALVLPFSCALLIGVMIRSVFLTYKRGGIYWRGTFYSLRQLKKMRS